MRTYQNPPEIDRAKLSAQAKRRRQALAAAGCSTYSLGFKHHPGGVTIACIVCLCCGLGSAHENDIAEKYCGFCHEFHSEEEPE